MVKLLVDATALSPIAKGVGRYVVEVSRRLDHLLPPSWSIHLVVFARPRMSPTDSGRATLHPIPRQSDLKLGLWTMPGLIRRLQPDLFLRFGDTVGMKYSVPTFTVCHDINELIFQAQQSERGLLRTIIDDIKEYFRVRSLRESDFVFCNSLFTKSECQARYGIPEGKTSVAYCGVDQVFYSGERLEAVRNVWRRFCCRDYVLTFACGDPRENFSILPEVIHESKRRGVTALFAVAGIRQGEPYVTTLSGAMTAYHLVEGRDYVYVPFLSTDDRPILRDLYLAADYYLELSLHEGFGMQLAEALACGVTCLAPHHSALVEVGGGFTVVIDPRDAKAIADALADSYRNGGHASNHQTQIEHSRQFSWDRSAQEISGRLMQFQRTGTP